MAPEGRSGASHRAVVALDPAKSPGFRASSFSPQACPPAWGATALQSTAGYDKPRVLTYPTPLKGVGSQRRIWQTRRNLPRCLGRSLCAPPPISVALCRALSGSSRRTYASTRPLPHVQVKACVTTL